MVKKTPKPTLADVLPPAPSAGIQDQPLGPSHRGTGPAAPWSSAPAAPKLRIVTPDPPAPPPLQEPPPLPDAPEPDLIDPRFIPRLPQVNVES